MHRVFFGTVVAQECVRINCEVVQYNVIKSFEMASFQARKLFRAKGL